jgi:YggT family protein
MHALYWLITTVIELLVWVIILQVILSWLVHFNVVNMRNQFVYMMGNFLYRVSAPMLRPIQRILPNMGGIDLSPLVLILLLYFAQLLLAEYWPR